MYQCETEGGHNYERVVEQPDDTRNTIVVFCRRCGDTRRVTITNATAVPAGVA